MKPDLFNWRRLKVAGALAMAAMLAACGAGKDDATDLDVTAARHTATAASLKVSGLLDNGLVLPLEVLGDGSPDRPKVAEARLSVTADKLQEVAQLWFQCHRCGFYGAPEFEAATRAPTRIKASVRVLGAVASDEEAAIPWIDVTDATVTLADDERLHGGINGGMYTTRITLALDAATRKRLVALPLTNRIQFRFNGTDGESNGFRVLDLQLRDAGAARVDSTTVRYFDPATERRFVSASKSDVDAGKALWYAEGSIAKSSIVPRKLQAACASCHATDARDLQYFNYSNNAIVQRSLFHGLSDTQGRQIAAFVRSSLKSLPYASNARPWNPPYQPGPGLDANPSGWAGGAGLAAVLSTPREALNALFGKPVNAATNLTQAEIDGVMNPKATMNAREIPVALQFPDWNAWLPTIHPLDVWPPQADGSGFANGARFDNGDRKDPNGYYRKLLA